VHVCAHYSSAATLQQTTASTTAVTLQTFKFLLEYIRNTEQITEWEAYVAFVSGLIQAVIAVMSWMSVRLLPFLYMFLCDHAMLFD
jgi:hypothetical protein